MLVGDDQLPLGVDPPSPLAELQARLGVGWPHIDAARKRSSEQLRQLSATLHPLLGFRTDATCVVFGSLARCEFTSGSDIDWTLLVDAGADADHRVLADRIRGRFESMELSPPSTGGAFGDLTLGHDLVHRIGGDDDTNHNTTRRLLLLLESAPVGDPEAYDRVIHEVLTRYVDEDLLPRDFPFRVPRFLLNDVVRYWRTMAVDFAHKRRDRGPTGWALRTAKLRMSRKLMYASGLLSCFSCGYLLAPQGTTNQQAGINRVVEHLYGLVRATPLDVVAGVANHYFDRLSDPVARLFGAYDEFLGLLDDTEWRTHLKDLPWSEADEDPVYHGMRGLSRKFEAALTEMFFTCDTPVREFTRSFGVF